MTDVIEKVLNNLIDSMHKQAAIKHSSKAVKKEEVEEKEETKKEEVKEESAFTKLLRKSMESRPKPKSTSMVMTTNKPQPTPMVKKPKGK